MNVTTATTPEGKPVFELSGMIDERFDFESSPLGAAPSPLYVDLYGVHRINSIGIKKWITFFSALKKKHFEIFFLRVSPAIAEQMSSISNFDCGGKVLSVVLPFLCKACKKSNFFVKTKDEVVGLDLEQVSWPCVHCQKTELEFDDLADEYLRFWKKPQSA